MDNGLTANQLKEQIKRLNPGNFIYWVRFKAQLNPIGEKRKNRQIIDLYPLDSVEKIKAVMGG